MKNRTNAPAAAQAAAPTSKGTAYGLPPLLVDWSRPFRRSLAAIAVLTLGVALLSMLLPYTFAVVIDGVTKGAPLRSILVFGVLGTGVVMVMQSLVSARNATIRVSQIETRMLWHFRHRAAETVSRLSVGQTQNENSGYRQNVLSRGITAAEQLVLFTLQDIWPLTAQVVVISVALFFATPWWLALATFVVGGAQFSYRLWLNFGYVPKITAFSREEHRLDKQLSEFFRHLGIVQLNSQAERAIGEHDRKRHEFLDREIAFWVAHVWRIFRADAVATCARVVLFGLAAYLAHGGSMSTGMFLVFVSWSGQLLSTLDRFGHMFRQYARAVPHVRRLERLLSIEPAVRLPAEPYRPESGDIAGAIEFRDVRFGYPEKRSFEDQDEGVAPPVDEPKRALTGVSFAVHPGERVALVGKSGAGKSTVAQLLCRSYDPDSGAIFIDGVDIRSYDLDWLRSRLGYVEQDVTLFDVSVGENLALAVGGRLGDVPDFERVLAQSRVSDFVPRLGPDGFDTVIGERGIKLSGGERQRLGIARALAKRPRVIVFDEATASLDAENERCVYEALFGEGLSGITAVIIAHNLRTIRRADRIVFFEGGQVVATGTHAELMASCAPYRRLVEMHEYED